MSYSAEYKSRLDCACALEILHTYSLIHDDLPCMDNDDLRRGKPTLHKVVPEWHALLTGDYLLTFAFAVLANCTQIEPVERLNLIQILAQQAGSDGLIGGQMIDLLYTASSMDISVLKEMHLKKTASLFVVALTWGALVGKAPKNDMATLKEIGLTLGFLFQLQDDLLDYTSTTQALGKSILSDADKDKATAFSSMGLENTQKELVHQEQTLLSLLSSLSRPVPYIQSLMQKILQRKK
jgi:geranylgeranyl diphosphate synthase type II